MVPHGLGNAGTRSCLVLPSRAGAGRARAAFLGPAGWSRLGLGRFGQVFYTAPRWPVGWAWQQTDFCWRRIWRGCLDRYRRSWDVLVVLGGETTVGLMDPAPFISSSMVPAPPHHPGVGWGDPWGAPGWTPGAGGPAGLQTQGDCSQL